jgi:stage II sporulation protein D
MEKPVPRPEQLPPPGPEPAPPPAPAPDTTTTAPAAAPDTGAVFSVARNSARILLKTADGDFSVRFNGPFAAYPARSSAGMLEGEVRFKTEDKAVFVKSLGRSLDLPLRLFAPSPAARFKLDGRTYRGNLVVRENSKGKIILVNEVRVEDYLKGVVPYEIGKRDSIHLEALKVQAVAARTYTYSRLDLHPDDGFDLYADVQDQVYNGTESEYALASLAVDLTRDRVITHADTLIHAYYFSTSSGATANIEEVWPDKGFQPFLRTVEDSAWNTSSRYFFWKEEWSGAALERIVNRSMKDLFADFKPGRLRDVVIEKYTTSGRVKVLAVTVSGRTYRLYGDIVRRLLRRDVKGLPILRSAWFRLDVRKAAGRVSKVIADGRGYGHGVGLSQIGALQMAAAGKTCEEIVRHYYTDVRLAKVRY